MKAGRENPASSSQDVDYQTRFPRWDWVPKPGNVSWTSQLRIEAPQGCLAKLDPQDLSSFFDFPTNGVFTMTLVLHLLNFAFFWKRGFHLRACAASDKTFRDLTFWLGRALPLSTKSEITATSTLVTPTKTALKGRALPQAAIVGAIPRFTLDELSDFAGLLVGGCSTLLSTWECPISYSLCPLFLT